MLIWANKNEIDFDLIDPIERMYSGKFQTDNLRELLKAWELSVIFRQIKRHFGERYDISIMDFGAGISPFGAYLNHLGYQHVTCFDKEHCWRRARRMDTETYNKKYDTHVQYIKADVTSNYVELHDVIFSASVLEHIEDSNYRIKVMQAFSKLLKPGGLMIHVVDHYSPEKGKTTNIKELIDNCSIPISYKPEETPGCKEFKSSPKYTWWFKKRTTRIAFFNEK